MKGEKVGFVKVVLGGHSRGVSEASTGNGSFVAGRGGAVARAGAFCRDTMFELFRRREILPEWKNQPRRSRTNPDIERRSTPILRCSRYAEPRTRCRSIPP